MLSASVSFVLHAHLPWVRAEGPTISLEEGWLYEAMWQSYLPLFEMFTRLAEPRPDRPLCTLSLSPPLLSMLSDPHHRQRFGRYADELGETLARAGEKEPRHAAAIADHRARLARSVATFERLRGDLLAGSISRAAT